MQFGPDGDDGATSSPSGPFVCSGHRMCRDVIDICVCLNDESRDGLLVDTQRGGGVVEHGFAPSLERIEVDNIAFYSDISLFDQSGIRIAFSERGGGISGPPYSSLNLGLHVGDDQQDVLTNRALLLDALGVDDVDAARLVSAEQVHGTHVHSVIEQIDTPQPTVIPATDALTTDLVGSPLMLCFADCVPIVLVATVPRRVVSVVHSGWRGTLDGISSEAIQRLVDLYDVDPKDVYAYIGPYIGPYNFEVSADIRSQFINKFVTLLPTVCDGTQADVSCHIDLADAVFESLTESGVLPCNITSLGMCSVQTTDRFFSYRAEAGLTGRHGAVACIL